MNVTLIVNGVSRTWDAAPDERLLDTLRAHHVTSVKRGCETGACGACTVLVDDVPHVSCLLFTAAAAGRRVTTVEGVAADLGAALVEVGGVQCGFCTPGVILSAEALLRREPDPDEDAIRRALDGNLCRCTGYTKIVEGVRLAAARRRDGHVG